MTYYAPGTQEKDPAKVIMSLQQAHEKTATNTTNIATNTAAIATNTTDIATNTANIATNTANIATNTANIATNTANISALQTAGVGLTNSGGSLAVSLSKITASLGADVSLNNTGTYFDGPSIAQGTSGTWFVSGTVTLIDTGSTAAFNCKLWDGSTVIASARGSNWNVAAQTTVTLSGYITSPAGNLRISVKDVTATTGKILFNASGESKDSTISAIRIA